MPEAGRRISPARYCTSTLRPRKAEKRAILYVVSVPGSNRVNSTEGPPSEDCGKAGRWEVKAACAFGAYLQIWFVTEDFRAAFFGEALFRLSIESELTRANPAGRVRNP
jgi:hypothetical protein